MQLGRIFHPAGWLLALTLIIGGCATAPQPSITTRLDTLLQDPALQGATVSLMVRDAQSGQTLYQHNPGSRLIPASSLKLLTTAAALDVLGPQYRFSTRLLSDGSRQGDRLTGNLYLRGGGDPSLQWRDLQALARELAAQGIRHVQGDLVFDDSVFDAVRLGLDWSNDDEPTYYAAQISGLTVAPSDDFDAGSLIVTVQAPQAAGQPVRYSITPDTDYVQLSNRARSGPGESLALDRLHGTNQLVLDGRLAPGQVRRLWVSVWEPTALVANLFERALAEQGIRVEGRRVVGAITAANATLLASHDSAPLQTLITPLLKLSNNTMSEALLKAMGRQTANAGTASAGAAAVANFLQREGLAQGAFIQVDGSGLSRRNLVSAQNFTDLLLVARKQPWFDAWYAALPIAGNPARMVGGSLSQRLQGTSAADNLHGKTGSMTAVSSLTGYITDAHGRRLVFSMLSNNHAVEGARIKALEDRLAVILAQSTD